MALPCGSLFCFVRFSTVQGSRPDTEQRKERIEKCPKRQETSSLPSPFCLYWSPAPCCSGSISSPDFQIQTDAESLRGALEQESLIAGSESEYGLFVETVDGETADMGAEEWWCFTKGGEMLATGVDDTMIADGEHYEASFTVGW